MATKKDSNDERTRLLIFDNQSYIVNNLAMNLTLRGWEVTLVSEIDVLFYKLIQNQYNILILDIMAPVPKMENNHVHFTKTEINEMNEGMNTSVVLAKKIWQIKNYEEIPILFLSGRTNPIPSDPVLREHHCEYLRKPQWAKDVDQKLKDMLNQ